MNEKEYHNPTGMLLCSFGILCLAMLAMLTLPQVRAGKQTSNAVNAYYTADLEAEKIYARLQAGETIPGVTEEDGLYSYSCPISDGQVLMVEVRSNNGTWSVERWDSVVILPEDAQVTGD